MKDAVDSPVAAYRARPENARRKLLLFGFADPLRAAAHQADCAVVDLRNEWLSCICMWE